MTMLFERAPRTQVERRRTSDRALVRATLAIIAESGIEGVTLRAVGERAGYSRGIVNYHFGSKQELLGRVIGDLVDRWSDNVLEAAIGNRVGIAALRESLTAHLGLLKGGDESRVYFHLIYAALGPMPELRGQLASGHAKLRTRFADWLRGGQAEGEIRFDADPEMQALLFYASIRGLVYQWMLDPNAVNLAKAYDALIANCERALLP